MNTLRTRFPVLLLLAGLLSAFTSASHRLAAGREVREVAAFTAVTLANSATVIVTQGSPQKVEVEASAEDLARLETTVKDGKLRIGAKQDLKWTNLGKVTVYITVPEIKALAVSGSGVLKTASVQTSSLSLSVSGSGQLQVSQLQASELRSAVSGSGTIAVAGTCPQHVASISGSGSIRAAELRSESCQVRISGSGSCRLHATRTLDASLHGSGDVLVTGNPTISSKTAGSGRVRRS